MDVDSFTDAPLDAIARLLFEGLRAKFGEEIVAEVIKRPVTTAVELSTHQMPLLVVARQNDRADADDDISDNEVCTILVEYYASLTPLDRLDARWPSLRAVYRFCLTRIHAGFDPLVTDHHVDVSGADEPERFVPMLAAAGWSAPARPVANVRYLLAPSQADPQPAFQATVTMRTSATFDWTLDGTYTHPDLDGIDGTVSAADPEPGDPDHSQPAFSSSITFD